MDVDYIIVGSGLAGISFCEQLKANNKTFVVFDNNSQQSSAVAGGLYNPVVLKRFTSVWKSEEQMQMALPMYHHLELQLGVKLDYKLPVRRKFTSIEEQNDWFTASDKPNLNNYLAPKVIKNDNKAVKAPFGFGEVLNTGRIDVKNLMCHYKDFLLKNDKFIEKTFDYNMLNVSDSGVQYENIKAKYIVFAEGFGVTKNPYFNNLPLVPTKGELLTIYAPNLKIDYVLKGAVFLIPLGQHYYTVGATYEWEDTTHELTKKAKNELIEKLKTIIDCAFEITEQVAGIRPTVKDRRPLVGQHSTYKNMFVLNGLGTRGVMIGPYVAKQLFDFVEKGVLMEKEIDIARYTL
ncbi:FAD-dependent oxidoreductase [Pseudalgibacter alginicilyticus]|uniref:FAD-dependent oxidoreductase n=1 Tax=Pseudalgibacter alginicilyticus TaxID=1736674 RepID=A0A0P0D855_9FLAO|nr:FAD-binding oxidoreductase [Pseudalgibacter alginicilyticus]ALJ04915.1 FAD-dependent oxidoreductase [Pseudalgibacter alginicilyticus]